MDVHGSVGGPYNVRGFPTIKIFGANKQSPQDYNGTYIFQSLCYLNTRHVILLNAFYAYT